MREIKFRAWCKNHKRMYPMVEHGVSSIDDGEHIPFDHIIVNDCALVGSHDFEIMQFTGIKGNGKQDVYEGDIVDFQIANKRVRRAVITFSDGAFWLDEDKRGRKSISAGCPKIMVIGNIYENGDLVE